MTITLTKPVIGSTAWGTAVNDNFTTIESQLNAGICKAWVNFNGTGTPAIRNSYNVISLTDVGTGVFTVNLDSSMSDAEYAVFALGQRNENGPSVVPAIRGSTTYDQLTTTGFTIRFCDTGNSARDPLVCVAGVFGDS